MDIRVVNSIILKGIWVSSYISRLFSVILFGMDAQLVATGFDGFIVLLQVKSDE